MYLIPEPKERKIYKEKSFIIRYNSKIIISSACDLQVTSHAKLLKQDLENQFGFTLGISKGEEESQGIYIDILKELQDEEYKLEIQEDRIRLWGGSNAGILYGIQTLRQLVETQGAVLPCLDIVDYPDIPNRGFYHDVTRGRIPTLESLKALADKLAYYKINQLQLYIEHSFLFKDFSEVWRDDTPLTPEEILELDVYCRNLHIDLVPSIASFGHLYKVLKTKTYTNLCELPDSDQDKYSLYERMHHHTLDISNEESFQFVARMLKEYMPLFSSKYFNICADETFDLGKGKSKELVQREGLDNAYVGFLSRICEFILENGRKPMFWGDIICGFPEALQKLPKDIICLNWGYAPNQDESTTKLFADAGVTQYVCPGVQGWNQIINRYRDAYDNISRMCSYALKYKAIGVLNTDWGDVGHMNHPEFSIAGMIYGAAFSWNGKIPEFEEMNRSISRIEYGDLSESFLSMITQLSEQSVFTWLEVVCLKEVREGVIREKPWVPILENISFPKVEKVNRCIDDIIIKLYEQMYQVKTEKRPLIKAYLIVAEGMKLWNEIGAMIACGVEEKRTSEATTLAIRLEYWYQEYRKLWLSTSKEAELYRIGEIAFWYADYLRNM